MRLYEPTFVDPDEAEQGGIGGDWSNPPGTLICDEDEIVEQETVTGIAYARDEAQVSLRRVKDRPGVAATVFEPLAEAGINGGINRWGSITDPDAPYAFRPPKRQGYLLLEVETHPFSPQWSLLTSVAADFGELTDNVGVMTGLRRKGTVTVKND